MSFLGIDLGTSGLRALLVGEDGKPIGAAERSCSVQTPAPGWSEQDPGEWIAALDQAVAELRESYPEFSSLRGIGVAGHMHGATLMDEAGKVLRPCILWNDTRSDLEAARLDQIPGVRELSGNIVFPGFTAPKLEWVRLHEPDVHARVAKVLLPAAFLTHYLTGDHVADMSDSAGTSWLDLRQRRWSPELLSASRMRADQMPQLVEGADPAGQLRPELKRAWGLQQEVVVAGGAGDNAAAACGIGALDEGQGFVSLGTSGVILVARDGCHPVPESALHTFCHAVPGRWYQMGVMLSATDSLNWLSRITGQGPAALTEVLGTRLLAPGRERFLPYLSGERTPHNDARIRAGFTGLGNDSDLQAMTRAVLEGVCYGLRDSAEALRHAGARPQALYVIGGGTASAYWLKLLATVLDMPLLRPRGGEFGAALGAARLGLTAATGAAPEKVMLPPEDCELVEPETALRQAFNEGYAKFRAAYQGLSAIQ